MVIISKYETEYNEEADFFITSKEECTCPCCGGRLKYRDHSRRLKCTNDKYRKFHNELPDCMFPYKYYDVGLIEDVVEGVWVRMTLKQRIIPVKGR